MTHHQNIFSRILMLLTGVMAGLCQPPVSAQESFPQNTLSEQQVLAIVRSYHPVARVADIGIEKARADIRIARGQFDPVLGNTSAQKTFDGNDYYYYNRYQLEIPAWFGVELNAGLEYLSGNRANPEETRGESSYLGLKLPLLKNLLMDKRRAALQNAKIFREASEVEKQRMLNDLLRDAAASFWDWNLWYQLYSIWENAEKVNKQRVDFVRSAFRLGDRPAIDTTEALTQLQLVSLQKEQAWLEFRNAGLDLSQYLWTAGQEPFELPEAVVPDAAASSIVLPANTLPDLEKLLETARKLHPDIAAFQYRLQSLEVEKKLKFQELLPDLSFKYNQLGRGYDIWKTGTAPLFENNYQYGISLGVPLRFSEGRGAYRKAKLNITETRLRQDLKTLQVENKVRSAYNKWETLQQQVVIQEQALQNYQALQRGEETRFSIGESSLFLVNARETKTLEASQKLRELQQKSRLAYLELLWASGILGR